MKKGWQIKKLGDVCDFEGGSQPPKSEFVYDEKPGYLRFLQIRDFGSDKNITYIRHSKKNRLCDENDILIGRYGASVGKILTGKAGSYNVALMKTLPNLEVLDQSWFYHFLISDEFQKPLLNVADRSAQAGFSKDDIYNFPVPVPPLAEQQRIVSLLDEAFEGLATAKANAEKNLQNARALFESHLQSVFTQRGNGWVEKPLGDLCDFLNGFAFKSGDALAESQTQLVRMGNLYGNQLDLDRSPVFYPDGFATEHSRYVLEEGDIIMSLTGTTGKEDYGFAVRIPDCGLTLLMNQRIMKFDALKRDIIDDGYLLHYLRSRCFLDVLYPTANGTRQANLSSVTIKLLPVPLRSLKEQKAIATKLDDLREETQRLARIYERKLAALAELKKSLLHQAFTGEL